MIKKVEDTKYILDLKKQVREADSFLSCEFWLAFSHKMNPLFDESNTSHGTSLVTLLYQGDENTQNLYMIPEIDEGKTLEFIYSKIEGTDIWYVCFEARGDLRFEYSLSINDEFGDNWDHRFENLIYDKLCKSILFVEGDEGEEDEFLSNVQMPYAPTKIWSEVKVPNNKGRVIEHYLESKSLPESRRIQVYLPHDYSDAAIPYSFILFNDGDEYVNILGACKVLDNLIEEGVIGGVVAVFVDSTDDRGEALAYQKKFEDTLLFDVIPWINDNYNIQMTENNNTIAGLSLGGSFACHLGLVAPDIFSSVISQSGAFWVGPDDEYEGECWLYEQYIETETTSQRYYFDVGILEEEKMTELTRKMALLCKSKGAEVMRCHFPGGHDYLSWGETLADALRFIYQETGIS